MTWIRNQWAKFTMWLADLQGVADPDPPVDDRE